MNQILKTNFLVIIMLVFISEVEAQNYNTYYGGIVANCKYDSVNNKIAQFESYGLKNPGSAANINALNWLKNNYISYGYSDIVIDTFSYSGGSAYNLIVTKTGSLYPNTFVIVDGHYDTKTGPGANDNGSGISIILEVARLLKNVNTKYSIKFINFSAEELGLVGSSAYVNNVVGPQNLDIKVLLNIDEVGGINGQVNNTIVCERDESNPSANNVASANYTDTLARCVQLYSNLFTQISYAYASDYMPFQSQGEIITGLFESNQSPYPHTVNDVMANMDVNYVYEIAKASIGATLYFAEAIDPTGINEISDNTLIVYPNPANDLLKIDLGDFIVNNTNLKLIDVLGNELLIKHNINAREQIDISQLNAGIYFVAIENENSKLIKKIVVE